MHALRAPVVFDGERFLGDGATVLVDGDSIVGVEPFGYDVPAGCPVRAFTGTLLPGLFDAHTHLVATGEIGSLEAAPSLADDELDAVIIRSLQEHAAAGVTTVRDLGDTRYRTVEVRDRPDLGVPRILAAGPPITVTDGHCHFLGGVAAGTDEVRRVVTEHRARDVDVVKVMASGGMVTFGSDVFGVQFSPAELAAVVDVAHELDLPVLAHAHSLAGIRHALDAGVDGIEHVTGLTENGIEVPDDVLEGVAAADVVLDLTLGYDRAGLAAMPGPPPHIAAQLEKAGLDFESAYAARLDVARRIRQHGIRLVAGDDSGVGPLKRHGGLPAAVVDLALAGYPPAEALATATAVAADVCGLAGTTGRLAPRLAADLLVVDGDLRSDLGALLRPVAVLVRGDDPTG
jgi:imidazolonepropionase-like amidohydrolase